MENMNRNDQNKGVPELKVENHIQFKSEFDLCWIPVADLGKKIGEMMNAVFSNYVGVRFSLAPTNAGSWTAELVFDHSENQDSNRICAVTRFSENNKSTRVQNNLLRKIRSNDSRNKFGDRFLLSDDAKDVLSSIIVDELKRPNGSIDWGRAVSEFSTNSNWVGQRSGIKTKVGYISLDKLIAKLYGESDDKGKDVYRYKTRILNVYNQRFIEVSRYNENHIVDILNSFGVNPFGANDIY